MNQGEIDTLGLIYICADLFSHSKIKQANKKTFAEGCKGRGSAQTILTEVFIHWKERSDRLGLPMQNVNKQASIHQNQPLL